MSAKNSKCWQGVQHGSWLYISRTNVSILCLSMWTRLPCTMPNCPCDSLYSWVPCKYNLFPLFFLSAVNHFFTCMLPQSLLFSAAYSKILNKINEWVYQNKDTSELHIFSNELNKNSNWEKLKRHTDPISSC